MSYLDSGDETSPGSPFARDPRAVVKWLALQAGRAGHLIGGEFDRNSIQQASADAGPALGSQMRGPEASVAQLAQNALHALAGGDDRYRQAFGYQPLSPADAALAQAKQREFQAQRNAADPLNQVAQATRNGLGALKGSDQRYYDARGFSPPAEAQLAPLRRDQRAFAAATAGPAVGAWGGGSLEHGSSRGAGAAQVQGSLVTFGNGQTAVLLTHGGFGNIGLQRPPVNPPDGVQNPEIVVGDTAGVGGGLLLSNAYSPEDLRGPAMTYNVNLGPLTGSYSTDHHGHYVLSGGWTVGPKSLDFSSYPTYTDVVSATPPRPLE